MDYKYYDFSQAEIISKDAVRTISYLFENFARLVGTSLSTYLRIATEVVLEGIEQMDYGDFVVGVETPTSLTILGLRPLTGLGLIDLSLNFIFLVLDRLLGGKGAEAARLRELTDIEQALVGKLVRKILNAITETWAAVVPFRLTMEGFETNPQMIQVFSNNERMFVLKFRIKIAEVVGHMHLLIPSASFEPLRQKLVSQDYVGTHDAQQAENVKEEFGRLHTNISKVSIPVIVELSKTTMSLRQIMQLEKGEMLPLMCDPTSKVNVNVKDKLKFRAMVGASGTKKAVKLIESVERKM